MSESTVEPGRAAPFHAPPYTPQWTCKTFKRISVICDVDPVAIEAMVSPTPFEVAGTRVEIFHDDMSYHSLGSFNESGVCVPVAYKGFLGLMHAVMFITSDVGLIAGREVFGYPKLIGDVDYEQDGSTAHAETRRDGEVLMRVSLENATLCTAGDLVATVDGWRGDDWEWSHHLVRKSMPRAAAPGADVEQVIYRNIGAVPTSISFGTVDLTIAEHPLLPGLATAEPCGAFLIEAGFGHEPEDRRVIAT